MQNIIDEYNQDSENIEIIEKGEKKKEATQIAGLNLRREEYKRATDSIEIENKDNQDNKDKVSTNYLADKFTFKESYSSDYVRFNVKKFLENIIDDFIYWEENGTEDSLFKIAEIKDKINYYSKYLNSKDESSVFLNMINLLMDNNYWDKISTGQLKILIHELKRFEDGAIDWEKLNIFSKQIDRLKISILTVNEEQKKEKD